MRLLNGHIIRRNQRRALIHYGGRQGLRRSAFSTAPDQISLSSREIFLGPADVSRQDDAQDELAGHELADLQDRLRRASPDIFADPVTGGRLAPVHGARPAPNGMSRFELREMDRCARRDARHSRRVTEPAGEIGTRTHAPESPRPNTLSDNTVSNTLDNTVSTMSDNTVSNSPSNPPELSINERPRRVLSQHDPVRRVPVQVMVTLSAELAKTVLYKTDGWILETAGATGARMMLNDVPRGQLDPVLSIRGTFRSVALACYHLARLKSETGEVGAGGAIELEFKLPFDTAGRLTELDTFAHISRDADTDARVSADLYPHKHFRSIRVASAYPDKVRWAMTELLAAVARVTEPHAPQVARRDEAHAAGPVATASVPVALAIADLVFDGPGRFLTTVMYESRAFVELVRGRGALWCRITGTESQVELAKARVLDRVTVARARLQARQNVIPADLFLRPRRRREEGAGEE